MYVVKNKKTSQSKPHISNNEKNAYKFYHRKISTYSLVT